MSAGPEPRLESLAKGSLLALWSRAYAAGLTYLVFVIIGRALGPRGMGSFYLGFTILTVLASLCQLGLGQGALRFVSVGLLKQEGGRVRKTALLAVGIAFSLSLVAALGLLVLRTRLAEAVFRDPALRVVLPFIAAALPFYCVFLLLVELLKGFGRIGPVVGIQNVAFPSLLLFLSISLLAAGSGLLAPLISLVCSAVSCSMAFLYLLIRLLPPTGLGTIALTELLGVSLPIYVSTVMSMLMAWADVLMLGVFQGPVEVGIYTAAARTAILATFFLQAVNYLLPPLAARFHGGGEIEGLEPLARRTASWNLTFALTVVAAYAVFGREILKLFGHSFKAGYGALLILSLGQAVNAGAGSVGYIMAMTGLQRQLSLISTLSIAIDLALNALLIPRLSILGAALATALSLSLWNVLCALFIVRCHRVRAYAEGIFKIVWSIGMVTPPSVFIKESFGFFLSVVFFTVVLFIAIIISLNEADKNFFFKKFKWLR